MKKHLFISLIAYAIFGVGATINLIGFKAGISPEIVFVVFTASLIFYVFAVFTSLEKVKRALNNYEKPLNTEQNVQVSATTDDDQRKEP